MDAQLAAWLVERGLENAAGWALCFSSLRGDPKNSPSGWHQRCDGHDRTVVVGTNSLQYIFGAYAGHEWGPSTGSVNENSGQFLFRLAAPRLGAETYDAISNSNLQILAQDFWPRMGLNGGTGELGFGVRDRLGGSLAYCNQGSTYQGNRDDVCGGSEWGESEIETWYAL